MITLPDLPYAYEALSPTLSEATMRTHHDKHHANYVEVANKLAAENGLADEAQVGSLGKPLRCGGHRRSRCHDAA